MDLAKEAGKPDDFIKDLLHVVVQDFTTKTGTNTGQLMNPQRLTMAGSNQGPGLTDLAGIPGKEEFPARIEKEPEAMRKLN